MVDRLTKMANFTPCKDTATAHDLAQLFIDNVWKHRGLPLRITTDRGPEFTNKFIAALCEIVGTMHCKSTAYHPQSDGQTMLMCLQTIYQTHACCCQYYPQEDQKEMLLSTCMPFLVLINPQQPIATCMLSETIILPEV